MSKPLVSVVIATYNCERFIIDTIESMKKQTFKDFELIIIDDCSTDDTVSIMEESLVDIDQPYQIIKNKKNIGTAGSRNIGNKIAKGELIAVVDHDDISLPIRLEEEVKFLNSEKSFDACSGHMVEISANGEENTMTFTPPSKMKDIKKSFFLTCDNVVSHPASMYRRKTFFEMGAYDPDLECSHDFDLWMKMIMHGKNIYNLPIALIKYRIVIGSIMHDSRRHDRMRKERSFVIRRKGALKSEWDEKKNGKYEFEYKEVRA